MLRRHALAIGIAALGGVAGVLGALVEEIQAGGFFPAFVAGPIIEEFTKPAGVYYLLARKPAWLASQLHTALLAGLAGLVFGAIEGLVYVTVYWPDASTRFVVYRFTIPLALHFTASFIFGLAINHRLIGFVNGKRPLRTIDKGPIIAAIAIHSLYNIIATVLELSDTLNLD